MLILWKNLEKSTVKSCQKDMRIWKLCPRKEREKNVKEIFMAPTGGLIFFNEIDTPFLGTNSIADHT